MATVTGFTAERMLEIEGASVIEGEIVAGNLILTKHDGTQINAGPVLGPAGPAGPPGPAGVNAIPGEVRLWSGDELPAPETYGIWVWADGAVYPVADHPLAAAHIGDQWRTFDGASDPGVPNFRVPDLRGLVASGLDAMPGGARANRMTRTVAITLAKKTGKETHAIVVGEVPSHTHTTVIGSHLHVAVNQHLGNAFAVTQNVGEGVIGYLNAWVPGNEPYALWKEGGTGLQSIELNNVGGNGAHENVQPTVFVPYIVCLDD
jgi:microcystin-dependent protein